MLLVSVISSGSEFHVLTVYDIIEVHSLTTYCVKNISFEQV